jgi:hypothetical protein
MRLILVKVLWNFKLELCDEGDGWKDQRVRSVWQKKPLLCRVTPIKRGVDKQPQTVA